MRYSHFLMSIVGAVVFSMPAWAQDTWTLKKKIDALTDDQIVIASQMVEVSDGFAGVAVRCDDGEVKTFIFFQKSVDGEYVNVRYRIGQAPLQSEGWIVSGDGNAVYPSSEQRRLARELMNGGNFIVEIENTKGERRRATFSLAGSKKAITAALQACGAPLSDPRDIDPKLMQEVVKYIDIVPYSELLAQKKSLIRLGYYKGPVNKHLDVQYAQAVQKAYENYLDRCDQGLVKGDACRSRDLTRQERPNDLYKPPVYPVMRELSGQK
jgi:hypothetical protein